MLSFATGVVNFLPQPFFYKYLNLDEIIDLPINDAFTDYNYSQTVFILNYAQQITGLILVFLSYPVVLLLSRIKWKRLEKLNFKKAEKSFRFNLLWRVLIEYYLEFSLNAFMNIYALQFSTPTQQVATFISFLAMLVAAFGPPLALTVIQNNRLRIKQKWF